MLPTCRRETGREERLGREGRVREEKREGWREFGKEEEEKGEERGGKRGRARRGREGRGEEKGGRGKEEGRRRGEEEEERGTNEDKGREGRQRDHQLDRKNGHCTRTSWEWEGVRGFPRLTWASPWGGQPHSCLLLYGSTTPPLHTTRASLCNTGAVFTYLCFLKADYGQSLAPHPFIYAKRCEQTEGRILVELLV